MTSRFAVAARVRQRVTGEIRQLDVLHGGAIGRVVGRPRV
jgi:hypothetical protein